LCRRITVSTSKDHRVRVVQRHDTRKGLSASGGGKDHEVYLAPVGVLGEDPQVGAGDRRELVLVAIHQVAEAFHRRADFRGYRHEVVVPDSDGKVQI
jgi:hypothetical protein